MTCVRKTTSLPRGPCTSLWGMYWMKQDRVLPWVHLTVFKPGGPGGPWRPPSQTLMGDLSVLPFKTTSPVCVQYSSVIIETWPQMNIKLMLQLPHNYLNCITFIGCNVGGKILWQKFSFLPPTDVAKKYYESSLLTCSSALPSSVS